MQIYILSMCTERFGISYIGTKLKVYSLANSSVWLYLWYNYHWMLRYFTERPIDQLTFRQIAIPEAGSP